MRGVQVSDGCIDVLHEMDRKGQPSDWIRSGRCQYQDNDDHTISAVLEAKILPNMRLRADASNTTRDGA